ncbi:MAG TPA: helix-turn-helix domain-containing protein [Thermoanaerobaculia bacterium]|nr:helix-turn-helix domain-containing protein [Thermoanaerobaculia bacterium]
MDFAFVVRQRLEELHLDQRDLASASQVTESYISQILRRKKLPPLPNRTDIYDKMSGLLGLPREELARLAAQQHRDEIDRAWRGAAMARFGPMRQLILGKCQRREKEIRAIFEKDPFGELERLITRTLIEVIRDEARAHARDETWLHSLASTAGQSYRKMRVQLIDLLDSDPSASIGDFTPFIEPLLRSWDFDLDGFVLVVRLTTGATRRFVFGEDARERTAPDQPGLRAFLRDSRLSAGATGEELAILRSLHVPGATPLFFYRTLQSLRDPLNFK